MRGGEVIRRGTVLGEKCIGTTRKFVMNQDEASLDVSLPPIKLRDQFLRAKKEMGDLLMNLETAKQTLALVRCEERPQPPGKRLSEGKAREAAQSN